MMIDWLKEAERHADEIMDIREDIHAFPERGNEEFRTAELIEDRLHSYGIPTRRLLGTAVIGELRGTGGSDADHSGELYPQKTVALRADIDALPIEEKTDWAFASNTPGLMHACGHDIHTAAALGAARLLSKYSDCFSGTVRFVFQPDEEGSGGADRLVRAGVMDGVGAVFGAHVSPDLPAGTVGIRYGKFYAAADVFTISIQGKSSHGAEPEKGIDALAAAARMVTALEALPSIFLPERSVLTVGTFRAGTATNILAGDAEITGIIRTLGSDTRKAMKARFADTVRSIEADTGVTASFRIRESYPGVVNTDPETAHAEQAALRLFGPDRVIKIDTPTMTTEDFGYYIDATSAGSFYHIGVGGDYPLHNEHFLPSGDTAVYAAAMHAETICSWLMQA